MKVKVAVLASPSLIALWTNSNIEEIKDGFLTELRNCVKVEVAVLGPNNSP